MTNAAASSAIPELAVEDEALVRATPSLVWAIASDTNRWDRIVGAGPSSYATQVVDDQPQPLLVGHGKFGGIPLSWLERGEWLEGKYLVGERRYLTGPLSCAGFRVDVSPDKDGTRVRLRSYLRPKQQFPDAFAEAILANLRRAVDGYLSALDQLFTSGDIPEQEPGEPAAAYGRRALLALEPQPKLDRVKPANEAGLAACAERLAALPIDKEHLERLLLLVRTRSDVELEQVRPFALAKQWGVRRRPLLRSFLHASTAGLFDLRWQLNCPHCRVGADVAERLSAIHRQSHCDACDLDFDVDFADNVEAVFRPNPAVREIKDRVYCTSSPWFRPHVFAVVELQPGEVRQLTLPVSPQGFVARCLIGRRYAVVDGSAARLVIGPAYIDAEPRDGDTLELVNGTDELVSLMLERRTANSDATHGTDILTLPEFIDQFGAEAPASGIDLTIGHVVVLFSDLTNTTSAYRSLGDARAFSLVHEHFRDMTEIVADHEGAILKTMGDAVMASFVRAGDAVAAALAMIESTRSRHGAHGFHLKVGVHEGPCVMVRANQRMDLFGTTVNIASRLQEQAEADQLVVLTDLLGHADVDAVLDGRQLERQTITRPLRGLGADHTLAVLTLPPRSS